MWVFIYILRFMEGLCNNKTVLKHTISTGDNSILRPFEILLDK